MPPVRIFIPTLTGGVSRQPQTQRLSSQSEDMDNVMLALAKGTEKRPGTEYIDGDGTTGELTVTTPTSDKGFFHWINRDSTQRFVLSIDKQNGSDDVLEAFDLNGNQITVEYDAGKATELKAYLMNGSADAIHSFCALTIADTTIIVNKSKVTATSGSETIYQYSATDVHKTTNAHNKVNGLSFDYPPTASAEKWWARESAVGFPAGPYESQNHTGAQPWYKRLRSEAANSSLNPDTMPIKAVYDAANNKFVVSQIAWSDRYSGDTVTNPPPAFIGKGISAIALYGDRLFFAAEESIIGSVVGDYYNFWVNDYANIADDDPVSIQVSVGNINNVESMTVFSKALVIHTSGSRQFELRADGSLTPNSAVLVPTTSYKSVNTALPVTMGSQLYFAAEHGPSMQLYSYAFSFEVDNNLGSDLTAQVVGYIPVSPLKISTSPNNDLLVIGTSGDATHLYTVQAFFDGSQRLQTAWARWSFGVTADEGCKILTHEIYDNFIYIVVRRWGLLFMEKMCIVTPENDTDTDGDMTFAVRLDRRTNVLGVYDGPTDTTTWTLPYVDSLITEVMLGTGFTGKTGTVVSITNDTTPATSTLLTKRGDYTAGDVWVGRSYTMLIKLSQQFYRDSNGGAVLGTLQLRQMAVAHKDTGQYEVWVTPEGRTTNKFRFSPQRLGSLASLLGQVLLEPFGFFFMKPLCSAAGSTIEIVNSSPTPSSISNIEIIGGFIPRKASIAQ